eukprot:CAMPEP_0184862638 /NCGR_PEP_ID=MMETSP0580-20130426/7074_1 /TAXON_ID=1118495 /ORGANISM="Dactyliosolen fragilissimus" /LENGTH=689 /DNA_ID=CAMNT_0027360591 /DNA_START=144 /DNA_END=2210 /DNA_ORIENTATION=+
MTKTTSPIVNVVETLEDIRCKNFEELNVEFRNSRLWLLEAVESCKRKILESCGLEHEAKRRKIFPITEDKENKHPNIPKSEKIQEVKQMNKSQKDCKRIDDNFEEEVAEINIDVNSMKVVDLRTELRKRGLDTSGLKKDLQSRLSAALENGQSRKKEEAKIEKYNDIQTKCEQERKESTENKKTSSTNVNSSDEDLRRDKVDDRISNNQEQSNVSNKVVEIDLERKTVHDEEMQDSKGAVEMNVTSEEKLVSSNNHVSRNLDVSTTDKNRPNMNGGKISKEDQISSTKSDELNHVASFAQDGAKGFEKLCSLKTNNISSSPTKGAKEYTQNILHDKSGNGVGMMSSKVVTVPPKSIADSSKNIEIEGKKGSTKLDKLPADSNECSQSIPQASKSVISNSMNAYGNTEQSTLLTTPAVLNKHVSSETKTISCSSSKSLQAKKEAMKEARKARLEEMRGKTKQATSSLASKAADTEALKKATILAVNKASAQSGYLKKKMNLGTSSLKHSSASKATTTEAIERKKALAAQMREKATAAARKQLAESNASTSITKTGVSADSKQNEKIRSGKSPSSLKQHQKPPSPMETYEMSDRGESDSEEESDYEDRSPKKKIPSWAQKSKLIPALENQFLNGKVDPDEIFHEVSTCDLEAIFDQKKKRYIKRTSSGNWTKDRVTASEKLVYKRTMGFNK